MRAGTRRRRGQAPSHPTQRRSSISVVHPSPSRTSVPSCRRAQTAPARYGLVASRTSSAVHRVRCLHLPPGACRACFRSSPQPAVQVPAPLSSCSRSVLPSYAYVYGVRLCIPQHQRHH
ncbi:hypothetical protein FKP32DRAFT_839254 [Trametes sanguinea]|nr:hypothetical protein FKP32DRAFT_839254 [Trametes sanguinea]